MIYKFYYPDLGVTQYKKLIKHSDYLIAKSLSERKEKKMIEKLTNGMEWFTDKSPYYAAISEGIFTCNNHSTRCIVTPYHGR